MSDWVISVPVWGERYLRVFESATAPALREAIGGLQGHTVSLIIHTNDRARVEAATKYLPVRFYDVPAVDGAFYSMSQAHRDVISFMAQPGTRVSLLTSDLIVSKGLFAACESQFAGGRVQMIGCAGMRACEEELPPPGMAPRDLLSWGWDHRHPMTRECTWSEGRSYDLWRMYFEKGDEVCCRLCLPHPLAFIWNRRPLDFAPTIDVNLVSNFDTSETYIVTNPDELAMIELSPKGKEFVLTEPFYARYRAFLPSIPTITHLTNQRHHWTFGHKIIIKGTGGDCGDQPVVDRMLHGI